MRMAIDVGNTNITIGVFEEKTLRFSARMATDRNLEPDQYALQFEGLLRLHGVAAKDITGTALSCVVPQITHSVAQAMETITGKKPLELHQSEATGVVVCIDNPAELGADLLAGAIAARHQYPLPAVVVDLGTATKLTAIDANGAVRGCSIAPGVFISLNALTSGASQLAGIALKAPTRAIGTNTVQSMQSGLVFGTAAMLDGMLDRFADELGGVATVLATGGAAGFVAPHCKHTIINAPTLLLEGLRIFYELNT